MFLFQRIKADFVTLLRLIFGKKDFLCSSVKREAIVIPALDKRIQFSSDFLSLLRTTVSTSQKQCGEQLAELTGIILHFALLVLKPAGPWKLEFAEKIMSIDNKLHGEGDKAIMSYLYKQNH